MALQTSDLVAQARLNAFETAVGVDAVLKIFAGALPANCAAADANGTPLAVLTLPNDWMAAAAARAKAKAGTWEDLTADNAGTASHFRIYASDGTTCHMQGTCGQGSGDMSLDNTNIAAGQKVTVTGFTLNEPNA